VSADAPLQAAQTDDLACSPRFYCAALPLEAGRHVKLPSSVAHHALKVLRLPTGSAIRLFNGQGGEYLAELEHTGKRTAKAHIHSWNPQDRASPLHTRLVQAVSSSYKMDWCIQKAAELGVHTIQPVFCQRTQHRLNATRAAAKTAHWQAVATATAEQCGCNRPTAVAPPVSLDYFLAQPAPTGVRLLLHPGAAADLTNTALALRNASGNARSKICIIDLLVGPEGALSKAEVVSAQKAGFNPCHLGPRILRTETAGLVALSILQSLVGDLDQGLVAS